MAKRARYTVSYIPRGSNMSKDEVVLAYDEHGARQVIAHYQRGSTVRRVRKGDFVNFSDQGGWRVNQEALHEAIAELDLKWPVRIKQTSTQGNRRGCCYLKHEAHPQRGIRAVHAITVKSYLSPEQADLTLRHELRHCWQHEQAARKDPLSAAEAAGIGTYSVSAINDAVALDQRKYRGQYRNSWPERDANAWAALPHKPITRSGR